MIDLVSVLVGEAGLSIADLRAIVGNAPDRYKVYEIDKRSGGKREIAQPAREVKKLQYILMEHVLEQLPVHEAATAYRPGRSILNNAKPHAGFGPILKMDFKDFFPSIQASDWLRYVEENDILSRRDGLLAAQILFRRRKHEHALRLSVGAPSSPVLSNALMYPFDGAITEIARSKGIIYTRSADDLTFSGQRIGMLRDMLKDVKTVARRVPYPTLIVNDDKTTFVTAAVRRQVTGVVLSNDGDVGIGRKRKRLVRARVHQASLHNLSKDELRALAGELAFINVIEPAFIGDLARKYGPGTVAAIKALVI